MLSTSASIFLNRSNHVLDIIMPDENRYCRISKPKLTI